MYSYIKLDAVLFVAFISSLIPDCDEATAAATDKENAAGTFRIPAPEDAGIFRAPAPVVSKRRILSIMTPKASLNSVFCDKRQVPYTVGCVPPPRYTFLKSLSADVKELLRDAKAARCVSRCLVVVVGRAWPETAQDIRLGK